MLVAAGRRRKPKHVFVYVLALPNGRSRRISTARMGESLSLAILCQIASSQKCTSISDLQLLSRRCNGASVPQRRRDSLSSSADCNFRTFPICARHRVHTSRVGHLSQRLAKRRLPLQRLEKMYMYILYVCMCVYIYIHKFIRIFIFMYIYICIYIGAYSIFRSGVCAETKHSIQRHVLQS